MLPYDPQLYQGRIVTLDFETTNLYKGNPSYDNRVVCAVWFVDGELKVATNSYRELQEDIECADVLVAHNAKFELKWLWRLGIDTDHLHIFDTILAEYTTQGNGGGALDLGSVCKRYGLPTKEPFIDKLMKSGVCPSEMPQSLLISRCKDDVLTTRALAQKLKKELSQRGLWPCYHTKALLCKSLAEIELQGMHLDKDKVMASYYEAHKQLQQVSQKLDEFTGGINHNSPKQKAEYLYDTLEFDELKDRRGNPVRTSAGGRKTDSDTVMALKPKTKQQEQYIALLKEYQDLYADVSKALEKFNDCVVEGELLFADFNQARSNTHRLTSSGTKHKVQFQNLHRKFRELFSARAKGWQILNVDYSQLEFRVAGYIGDDDNIREDIINKVDVHSVTQKAINDGGGSVDRTGAKPYTFRPLFGGMYGTPSEQAYYDYFKNRYEGLMSAQQQWQDTVINTGKLLMPTGLTFHWPDRRVNSKGYLNYTTKVCNYPIQYFSGSEIVPVAVMALKERLKNESLQAFVVNTVHDCAVLEVPDEEISRVKAEVKEAFTTDVYQYLAENYGINFDIPLGIEITVGSHWEIGEEEQYETVR